MWATMTRFFRGYKGFYRWIFLSQALLLGTCISILLGPFQTQELVNEGLLAGNMAVVAEVGLTCIFLLALAAGLNIANSSISVNMAEGTARYFRTNLYCKIQTFPFGNSAPFVPPIKSW
jgi:ABC-type multidrug transport system fused ATPase/permease subunit